MAAVVALDLWGGGVVARDGDGVPLEPSALGLGHLLRSALACGGARRCLLEPEAGRVAEERVRVAVGKHECCCL